MITKKQINGETYFTISDIAEMANVNIRTLQRWVNAGDLVNFLTVYQTPGKINYFKIGFPEPDDELIEGSTFKYKLKTDAIESKKE